MGVCVVAWRYVTWLHSGLRNCCTVALRSDSPLRRKNERLYLNRSPSVYLLRVRGKKKSSVFFSPAYRRRDAPRKPH